MKKHSGVFLTLLSGLIFGITPTFTKFVYLGGGNVICTMLITWAIAFAIFYIILKIQHISVTLDKNQKCPVLLSGIFNAVTTFMLMTSYNYIPVGMATSLHFSYPIFVMITQTAAKKRLPDKAAMAALLAVIAGLVCIGRPTLDNTSVTSYFFGFLIAIGSGVAYSVYILVTDNLIVRNTNAIKCLFYTSGCNVMFSAILAIGTGSFIMTLSGAAWFYTFLVGIGSNVLAVLFFRTGVCSIGGSTASLLSTFEPLASLVFGVAILHEELSPIHICGCFLILIGVMLDAIHELRRPTVQADDK